jgi:hypothetical protein
MNQIPAQSGTIIFCRDPKLLKRAVDFRVDGNLLFLSCTTRGLALYWLLFSSQ